MGNKLTTDAELTQVANAIRAKAGTATALTYPDGMVSAIGALKVGDDCNAAAGDIRTGKTAVVGRVKVTGNLAEKAAATYNVSSSDQSIAANQILTGAQTIRKVTTSNISAANIKKGVVVKVGDAGDDDRIVGVTGTYTSDATAAAGDIRTGKTAYVNGSKITGSLSEKAAATYNTSSSDQSISSGQILTGAQTIKAVTTSNISAGNIKSGVVVKVGDANNAGRIANVTGTYAPSIGTTIKQITFIFDVPPHFSGGQTKNPTNVGIPSGYSASNCAIKSAWTNSGTDSAVGITSVNWNTTVGLTVWASNQSNNHETETITVELIFFKVNL